MRKNTLQQDLTTWFKYNQRDLPWRENQDPYRIWVSEVMLQQTRVETVIPFYHRFIEKFPTVEALASADEEHVLKAWEGLGYYSRVRNLQSAVREVSENYNGVVPNTSEEISSLKGVGPYTAGAILSIAYDQPEPAVDGNVMRVLSRIYNIWDDVSKQKTRKNFEEIIRELLIDTDPSMFNQGLMELGALICTPRSPSCETCPVQVHCLAYEKGVQAELPVKKKKKAPKPKKMAAVFLKNENGEVLIHRRPNTGLLARLWEFPNHETIEKAGSQQEQLGAFLQQEFNIKAIIGHEIQQVEHVFSHLVWNITIYEGELLGEKFEDEDFHWVNATKIKQYPFPVSHQKIIAQNIKEE
ncbi:A/G-specific adenine glycosylase [Anaerobacillus sp. MEB173]|uniref:A/G-specific adenine glycosylase n=1 Tax=Anaerobacillus sp. MEB173 TaxID=3383345 RepID=UPI003F91A25C